MSDDKLKKIVEDLSAKAGNAPDAVKALNFSQAACNVANAMRVVYEVEVDRESRK